MPVPDLAPFTNLASAAQATMRCLQQHLGLGQWMFTRVEGDAWVILDTLGTEYPIAPGTALAWTGGDEFSILAVECDGVQGQELLARVDAALADASLAASVGFKYQPAERLFEVWKAADREMYIAKRARKMAQVLEPIA